MIDIIFYSIMIVGISFIGLIIYFSIKTKFSKVNYPDLTIGNAKTIRGGVVENGQLQGYREVKKSNGDISKGFFKDGVLQKGRDQKKFADGSECEIEIYDNHIKNATTYSNLLTIQHHFNSDGEDEREEVATSGKNLENNISITDISNSTATIVFKKNNNKDAFYYILSYGTKEVSENDLKQVQLGKGDSKIKYGSYIIEGLSSKTKYFVVMNICNEQLKILSTSNVSSFTTK